MTSLAIAVDLGGTKVETALVDTAGRVLSETRHRRPTGPASTSDELAASVAGALEATLASVPAQAELIGTGIGAAGPVDIPAGAVSPLNLAAWRGYPLQALVQETVDRVAPGIPTALRLDGQCITLAEHWVGAAQGVRNVMGMVVSTGIGGGLLLGGRIVPGPSGNAGHIGHVEVSGFDDPCACGGSGCLEAIASGPRTVAWARAQGWTGSTGEELAAAYEAGDDVARRAVQRTGRAIGQAIASASALVDLELVAIGGGFSHVTPDLFEYIREPIAEHTQFSFVNGVRVVPSGLSGDGPLIGAAALVHRPELLAG